MMFEIFMIFGLIFALSLLGTHYFGWKYIWFSKLLNFLFGGSVEQDLKEESLTLMSIGSMVGIGIGLTIGSIAGTSIVVGILFIVGGLISLKKNWVLCIQ